MVYLRRSVFTRSTAETEVSIDLDLDGMGKFSVDTGISFLDHIISSLAKHSMIDLTLKANSKDRIAHHLIEDVAIALAHAFDKALEKREGIARFGHAFIPMDDALAFAAIDLIKREYHKVDLKIERNEIEGIAKEDMEHFFRSFAQNMNSCMHIIVHYGSNDHHKIEAAMKALAVALRHAKSYDIQGVPSTKGVM